VSNIETTLGTSDSALPTSGAVSDAIAAVPSSPWSADTNGITYSTGRVGINVASNAAITLYVVGNATDDRPFQTTKTNNTLNAWVDYPSSFPTGYSYFVGTDATVGGANDWNGIAISARGNTGGSANAYAIIGAQSLSTSNHSSSFNVMLRGPGVNDYETVLKVQTAANIYWMNETSGTGDNISHFFRRGTTDEFIMGLYDQGSYTVFQINSGGSFGAAVRGGGDFMINPSGYIYMGNIRNLSGTYNMRYNTTSGEVSYTSSDARYKKDIKPFEVDALGVLDQFSPKRFTWIDENVKKVGWIAQEGKEVIPDMFPFIEKDDRFGMDEFNILPYYHKAIQQLNAKVKELEKRLSEK
jgi:hypothetical protein